MEKNRGGREMRDIEQEEENIRRNRSSWRCSCCKISGNRWGNNWGGGPSESGGSGTGRSGPLLLQHI